MRTYELPKTNVNWPTPIMIKIGNTARYLRDTLGLKQREVADALGITVVHLCNIENNKSSPSAVLVDKYRELWGVDLYVLAWCLHGDIESLPPAIREPARKLAEAWKEGLGHFLQSRN